MFLDQIYIQRLSHGHSLIGSDITTLFIKAISVISNIAKVLFHLMERKVAVTKAAENLTIYFSPLQAICLMYILLP